MDYALEFSGIYPFNYWLDNNYFKRLYSLGRYSALIGRSFTEVRCRLPEARYELKGNFDLEVL